MPSVLIKTERKIRDFERSSYRSVCSDRSVRLFLITAALWSEVNLKTLSLAVWMYPISRALSGLSVVSFRSAKSSGLLRTFQERADRKRTRIVLSIWLMSLAAGAIYIFVFRVQ